MRALSLLNVLSITASMLVISSGEKRKRVAFGDPVTSHTEYNTQHVVALIYTWACVSDQYQHQVTGCQFSVKCTGSILTKDFIATAAHCVLFKVVYGEVPAWERNRQLNVFGGLLWVIFRYLIVRERQHYFTSTLSILAGSPNLYKMAQKRHAERAFPHPNYDLYYEGKPDPAHHDIALIRVCLPFEFNKFVQPARMKPLDELSIHFDNIVSRSAACFIAGYGRIWTWQLELPDELHYGWRYMLCSGKCNKLSSRPHHQIRHPCVICTSPIHPSLAGPQEGDSGGPIVCDGYYTGIQIAGSVLTQEKVEQNSSFSVGYPLHCIQKAITKERLAYYLTIRGSKNVTVKLSPLDYIRYRRHTIVTEDEESFH